MSIATGGSSAVGSLSVNAEMVFNLAHEHDVLVLLKRIHHSPLSLELKNYLRDLVFSTRFGDVVPVDAAFIATFAAHGFKVVYEPATESQAPVVSETPVPAAPHIPVAAKPTGFGFQRSTPAFVAPKIVDSKPATVPAPVIAPAKALAAEPVVSTEVVSEPVVVASTSEPVSTPLTVTPTTAPPVMEDVVLTTDPVPAPPAPTTPVAASDMPPEPLPEPLPSVTTDSPADRIAAIKHEVNALVGNPVNLIDVNNDVGREYMNALLDAMKKSLGGTPEQEVLRAMARLERAFESVKQVLSEAPASPAEDTPTASPVSVPSDDNRWEAATAEPVVPTPAVVPEAVVSEPVVPEAAPTPVTSTVKLTSVADAVAMPEATVAVPAATVAGAEPTVPTSEVPTLDTPMVAEAAVPEAPAAPLQSSEVITSVAKEKQLRELMEARHAAEAEASAKRAEINANNPLMADDVTRGLTQLLSEWKLFKSSGIFGTGPSGHEHPLYKKLAPLTMAAVLAGRFDGATPEIKRSITDYMNGWRYEEGVTHEVGESFENYLRRVIRHILDKQPKS